jgi:hypothetical protein
MHRLSLRLGAAFPEIGEEAKESPHEGGLQAWRQHLQELCYVDPMQRREY